jgi:hypothetical protein
MPIPNIRVNSRSRAKEFLRMVKPLLLTLLPVWLMLMHVSWYALLNLP